VQEELPGNSSSSSGGRDADPDELDQAAWAQLAGGGVVVRVRGLWESPGSWHKWCSGPVARRMQDMPEGVKQLKPRKGEAGLPEDFLPFVSI
jgi:hypothetical protein